MRFTYTQAYQHLANRNRDGEKDLTEKFAVIKILRERYGLFGLTGEMFPITAEFCRMPDILIKGVRPIVIELDGGIHGNGDQISKRDKDVQRDKDYESVGAKLIIINYEDTNGYQTDKVINIIDGHLLRIK